MKTRNIIWIILLIGLSANAFAISEGDIVTQIQLDSINPFTIGLECQNEGITINPVERHVSASVSCLSVQQTSGSKYIIVRNKVDIIQKTFNTIKQDIVSIGILKTIEKYHNETVLNFNDYKYSLRQFLFRQQTTDAEQIRQAFDLNSTELN